MAVHHSSSDIVLVCGAGAAGCAAALSAARAGAQVHLIDTADEVGGTVTHCLIHTIGGLYDSEGQFLHDGLVAEWVSRLSENVPNVRPRRLGRTWVLNVSPDDYYAELKGWLATEQRLTLSCATSVERLISHQGWITSVHLRRRGEHLRFPVRTVIDATGTAEVVRKFDPGLMQDSAPTAAAGLILCLRGVAHGAMAFPAGVGFVQALRGAAQDGKLPVDCGKAWLDSGVREDEVYVKLFVRLPKDWRRQRGAIVRDALSQGKNVVEFLRQFPPFAQARVQSIGRLGIREAGRIRGEYCLTRDDVLEGRQFPDAACRCAWPIEFWQPEQGVSLQYLPAGRFYEIPLRALKVASVNNLWAVGKCMSADEHAHASARVAGCCWAMGQAAGRAAALS